MSAWLGTAIAWIPEVIRIAKPYFKNKPEEGLNLPASVAELQDASRTNALAITNNADALLEFAENTRKCIEALQNGAEVLRKEHALTRTIAIAAATAAGLSFAIAALALAALALAI